MTRSKRRVGAGAAQHSFEKQPAKLSASLAAIQKAFQRAIAARHRLEAQRARHDTREWVVKRRERTRHLIELGGLVVKARIEDLTSDDRAMIYGALLWMAEKLKSEQGEHACTLWTEKGKQALSVERKEASPNVRQEQQGRA